MIHKGGTQGFALGLAAVAAIGLWVWWRGGVKGAAATIAGAATDAAAGAVDGLVSSANAAQGALVDLGDSGLVGAADAASDAAGEVDGITDAAAAAVVMTVAVEGRMAGVSCLSCG